MRLSLIVPSALGSTAAVALMLAAALSIDPAPKSNAGDPARDQVSIPQAIESSQRFYVPGLVCDDCSGPTAVYGRAAAGDGTPIAGLDIAIIRGSFRVDAETGSDGTFTAPVPTSDAPYSVQFVGVICATSNWFPEPECQGVARFFAVASVKQVTFPQDAEVVLTFERVTAVLEGTVTGGSRASATRTSDGALSWADADAAGTFKLGLGPGTWSVRAQAFDPPREGVAVTVVVQGGGGNPPPVNLPPLQ
jgi:hypothetical protein